MSEIIEQIKKEKRIIVYGAGILAKGLVRYIRYYISDTEIDCVVVSNMEGNPSHILDVPVITVDSLSDKHYGLSVYIATTKKNQEEISAMLEEKKITKYISLPEMELEKIGREKVDWHLSQNQQHYVNYVSKCMEYYITRKRNMGIKNNDIGKLLYLYRKKMNDSKVYMGRLVVVVGTKCSLRCKECNNLMPHFRPQRDLEINEIMIALNRILQLVEKIECCELIGGEPFVSSNLFELLSFAVSRDKIKHIEITTNGTVLPSSELVDLLNNHKIEVRISDYGELSHKENLINFLGKNNINYNVLTMEKWVTPGGVDKRHRAVSLLRKYFNSCSSGYLCMTLFKDRIYHCARAASLHALGYMKEDEFLQVNSELTAEDILGFIKEDYSIACDYCDIVVENARVIKPAEQM